jgi:ribokinase
MSNRKKAVVVGYATNDFVVELADTFAGTGTTPVSHRQNSGWPRSGGAALYASQELARAGHMAAPITWIGKDADGDRYQVACRESGVGLEGVMSMDEGKTPTCILIYQPDGRYGCLFDAGLGGTERLGDAQCDLISSADLVVIAIGPPALGDNVLKHIGPDAIVGWIAKQDDVNYPMRLRKLYASRANYIFCNAGERAFVDASIDHGRSPQPVIFETRGSAGVLIDGSAERLMVPTEAIDAPDATGAGDTLAGATMASVLSGTVSIEESVRIGVAAAGALLNSRIH